MNNPQAAIFAEMGQHQWYVHLSRGARTDLDQNDLDQNDLAHIRSMLRQTISDCEAKGINLVVGFGPELLAHLGGDVPEDFQKFETISSIDGSGKEAIGTQEELLLWMNSPRLDDIWETQYDARSALAGHMYVARETITFIYGNSLDMTGFIDGTGNPKPEEEHQVALVPQGEAGEGGSFILAQRWVHDLDGWNQMSLGDQEKAIGRTKADSTRLEHQEDYSHLAHVEETEDGRLDEIMRRSTPYAFHDGTVGLYFMAFSRKQEILRNLLDSMYGRDGQPRDKLTDFSNPASGSYYFAPSTPQLQAMLTG